MNSLPLNRIFMCFLTFSLGQVGVLAQTNIQRTVQLQNMEVTSYYNAYFGLTSASEYIVELSPDIFIIDYIDLNEDKVQPFLIYPNPSSGTIHITGEPKERFFLIDMHGKKHYLELELNNQVNLSHFSRGTYILGNDKGEKQKIIIR